MDEKSNFNNVFPNVPEREEKEDTRGLFVNPPYPPQKPGEPTTVTLPATVTLFGNDGFVNLGANLGGASPLMSGGTFERSDLTMQREELVTAYREGSIAKRIIDLPSEDITRAWYTVSWPEQYPDDLARLRKLEAEHNVKQEITNAIRWARLFGGSIAIMIIAFDEDRMDEPLDPEEVLPGTFRGLLVQDLTQGVTPSTELVEDLYDPDFGLPMYYDFETDTGRIRVHHSRVLRFTGRELPGMETVRNNCWGASELEHIWDDIMNYENAKANVVQQMFQANLITLKMGNLGSDLAYGSDRMRQSVQQTIEQENRLRTSFGVHVLNAEDSMECHPYNFAGVSEIMETFMMDIAGAAEIPATMLFGRSPQGMNATGEADIRIYYDRIDQLRERMLRPVMEKLVPVMLVSVMGFIPEDIRIDFNPSMTISPAERSELSMKSTQEVIAAFQSGLVSKEQAQEELRIRGQALGTWRSLG